MLEAAGMPTRSKVAKLVARPRRSGDSAHVAYGKQVIAAERAGLEGVALRLGPSFSEAVDWVLACTGRVVVTGMGKSGFIAQKLSATFASTGTPSLYLHPAEALHGDLGRVVSGDLVVALSNSGATDELLRLMPAVRAMGARVIAITGDIKSPLAFRADLVLDIGPVDEACPMGLAPTASSLALLGLGDALAMTVLNNRTFSTEQYARLHPAGLLGKQARLISEVMRRDECNPIVAEDAPLSRAVAVMTRTPGRPGATSVVDAAGRLVGIFTDGDLRRLVEAGKTDFTVSVGSVCGHSPKTVRVDQQVRDAADLLRSARVDQLPVIDLDGRPVGLVDIQDLFAAKI